MEYFRARRSCSIAAALEQRRYLERVAREELDSHGWQTDYVSIRRQADLMPPQQGDRGLVALAASRLGSTRLIDNIEIEIKSPTERSHSG